MARLTLAVLSCISIACISNASPAGRIVGGANASEGQLRHQVSLRNSGSHNCGGSIISKYCILTAAHCVSGFNSTGNLVTYNPSLLTVRLGSTDRFKGGVLIGVKKIIVHENYGNFLNDVAILHLEEPITFSENIQPIELATAEVPIGKEVHISGWGRVKQGGDIPRQLKYNILTAISRNQCKDEIGTDSDSILCLAHGHNNGACNGDSGGPATFNGQLVGVAGFVYTGCGTKYPDGYAKVYYHRQWIKKHSNTK